MRPEVRHLRRRFQIITMFAAIGLVVAVWPAGAEQITDVHANVTVAHPAFAGNAGPAIAIDAGHYNFHTMSGRFAPFAALLRNDGFRVTSIAGKFERDSLKDINILVIANALNVQNENRWALPTPSAFTLSEIASVKAWVQSGGALLLIADHLPFAGAASELAASFGFTFVNGFALQDFTRPIDFFTLASNTLRNDVITRGRDAQETVTTVATFTGSAFKPPPGALDILVLSRNFMILEPAVAWNFTATTLRQPGYGFLQGAAIPFGKGRVAVFGEAGMFTAQIQTDPPSSLIGFNATGAGQNKQFILNVMHYLAGILPRR